MADLALFGTGAGLVMAVLVGALAVEVDHLRRQRHRIQGHLLPGARDPHTFENWVLATARVALTAGGEP